MNKKFLRTSLLCGGLALSIIHPSQCWGGNDDDALDYGRGGVIGAAVGRATGEYLVGWTLEEIDKSGGGLIGGAVAGHAQRAVGS